LLKLRDFGWGAFPMKLCNINGTCLIDSQNFGDWLVDENTNGLDLRNEATVLRITLAQVILDAAREQRQSRQSQPQQY
jgi:hypothetical protein